MGNLINEQFNNFVRTKFFRYTVIKVINKNFKRNAFKGSQGEIKTAKDAVTFFFFIKFKSGSAKVRYCISFISVVRVPLFFLLTVNHLEM